MERNRKAEIETGAGTKNERGTEVLTMEPEVRKTDRKLQKSASGNLEAQRNQPCANWLIARNEVHKLNGSLKETSSLCWSRGNGSSVREHSKTGT
ncbi:hypothetical protein AVEN_233752-1 [Araneus ventricosus]|uniref:Uncharacterized protein n=1 Tax=Araneus ventricosus TaxID=182803 RepID=A0A4Y2Q677_ARAVE|nr:hypothetical protein AVEN_233752-1 [Araneus ventricosus]